MKDIIPIQDDIGRIGIALVRDFRDENNSRRKQLLNESDWVEMPGAVNAASLTQWRSYRKLLRQLPELVDFTKAPAMFPTPPTGPHPNPSESISQQMYSSTCKQLVQGHAVPLLDQVSWNQFLANWELLDFPMSVSVVATLLSCYCSASIAQEVIALLRPYVKKPKRKS